MSKVRLPTILLPDVEVRGHRLPDVAIPTVDLRRAPWFDVSRLRRITFSTVGRPDVTIPTSVRELSMPDVRMQAARLSEVRIPELHRPDVQLPEMHFPEMHLPDVQLSDLHRPQFDLPQFERPQLSMPKFDLPSVEVRVRRDERRGPGAVAIATVVVGAAAAAGWWLWTSPTTGPRVRTAAIRVRRRAERTWALMTSKPGFDDGEDEATEQFWSTAEGWRPEGGGFEPGDATLEMASDEATADSDRAAAWEAPGATTATEPIATEPTAAGTATTAAATSTSTSGRQPMTTTEPIAPREPVGAGNGSGRHAGESPAHGLDQTDRSQ